MQVTITNVKFGQRLISQFYTWSMLLLCIYVSQGSTWWTLVTGVLFILGLAAQAKKLMKDETTILKSKAEAIAWANSLPDDEAN